MSSVTSILTHPGSSHKDELLACSLLLALYPVPIQRREPTPNDLEDPHCCVVDVGHQHDPELRNFDHHQFPKEHPPTCSLSLVLQHINLYEDALQFCDWLKSAEWFDCRGPLSTANWLEISPNVLSKLVSPIDITLLKRFSAVSRLDPGQPLWEVMKMVGEDLLDYLRGLRRRLDFIGKHAVIWTLDLAGKPAKFLFLPRIDPLPEDSSMGVDRYVEMNGLAAELVGTITPDRRSAGYGLSRYRDNARLDFSQLEAHPAVHFTHARGFIAKTSSTDIQQLKELLSLAAVKTD